jgi:RNA polymerase sigma factor (sigma-70 family)
MLQDTRDQLEHDVVDLIPALRRFARTLHRDSAGGDDLVQDTLMKALAALDQYSPGTNLKSWLFTIMKNTFCTRFQHSKREVLGSDDFIANAVIVAPEQEWKIRGHELEIACGNLRSAYRDTFQYVFLDGRSYEDAAEHFGCAVGTVKSRVNRARLHIARALGEEVV